MAKNQIERRTLLSSVLALPFLSLLRGDADGTYEPDVEHYSPFFKGLGKAKNISISTSYNMETMFDRPFYRYVEFPIEVSVEIKYEKGCETWTAFNVKNEQLKQFTFEKWFSCEFINGVSDFSGHIDYLGCQFKLASVTVNDGEYDTIW